MKGLVFVLSLLVVSLFSFEAQANDGGPGLFPLQARRAAVQNLRFNARQGRADFVSRGQGFQQLRVAPLIVPGCVGNGCFQPLGVVPVMQFRSQTIIPR